MYDLSEVIRQLENKVKWWYNGGMDYELAKKLKEAGWPQEENDHTGQHWLDEAGSYDHPTGDENECVAPPLPELIEACLKQDIDCFRLEKDCIIKFNGKEKPEHWRAECMSSSWSNNKIEFFGSTPEIAVSNLWLAIQKPNVV